MPEPSEADKTPPEPLAVPESTRHRPLSGLERGLSAAAGIALAGVAVVLMFYGKNDVADSVALLVAGVLVVMAVQGTPLIKLGGKDVSFEMAPRREAVAEIARAQAAGDPDRAKALLQGYQLADPEARQDPAFARAANDVKNEAFIRGAVEFLRHEMQELNEEFALARTARQDEFVLSIVKDNLRILVLIYQGHRSNLTQRLDRIIDETQADAAFLISDSATNILSAEFYNRVATGTFDANLTDTPGQDWGATDMASPLYDLIKRARRLRARDK